MVFMEACEKNFKACEEIIRILHENEISVSQSCVILDHAKKKIAQDSIVGKVIPFDREDS